MAAQTFWGWYDKELPRGDDSSDFQKAWEAGKNSLAEQIREYFKKEHSGGISDEKDAWDIRQDILEMISK